MITQLILGVGFYFFALLIHELTHLYLARYFGYQARLALLQNKGFRRIIPGTRLYSHHTQIHPRHLTIILLAPLATTIPVFLLMSYFFIHLLDYTGLLIFCCLFIAILCSLGTSYDDLKDYKHYKEEWRKSDRHENGKRN